MGPMRTEYFEADVERFNGRIAKIEANPDPTKLFSTKLRYELERDRTLERLKAWKEAKRMVYAYQGPTRIFSTMGFCSIESSHIVDRWYRDAEFFFKESFVGREGRQLMKRERFLLPV